MSGISNSIGLTINSSNPLVVTNGGTGTSTSFTAGSFVFAGSSGVYSQDNSNSFWDNTNKKMYLGGNTSNSLTMPGLLNLRGTDSTTNNAVNFYTTVDSYPGVSIFHDTHDNQAINFDAFWNGSNNISSYSGSNFQITHEGNQLQFNYSSGVAQGSVVTWTSAFFLNTSGDINVNTGNVIINLASKGYQQKSAAVSAGTANALLVTGVVLSSGASGTINNSAVTTSHVGFANCTSASGTLSFIRVTCSSGSFTVTGGSLDNSTYSVFFVKAI